jgi:hypothetical protein
MTDESPKSGLHIDADWKTEAAREKQRLAEQERKESRAQTPGGADVSSSFAELVNVLALQAAVALGGFQSPGGERIPPNPAAARHHIDLLEVLERKTAGNLTEQEQRLLSSVLYELRMQFVQSAGAAPAKPPEPEQT